MLAKSQQQHMIVCSAIDELDNHFSRLLVIILYFLRVIIKHIIATTLFNDHRDHKTSGEGITLAKYFSSTNEGINPPNTLQICQ